MKDRTFNLRELCREADVTERTVRYYIKEGLLPPPSGSGPFSRYTSEHWLRLQFIKRLKDEYLPLSEIKNLLNARSLPELEQLAQQVQLIPAAGPAAKGYEMAPAEPEPGDPLLGLLRRESGPGAAPARKMLREQMAPASWSVLQTEMSPFAALPEAANQGQPEIEPDSGGVFSSQVSSAPPVYDQSSQAGPTFQAHSFMARSAAPMPVPPGSITTAGGAMPDQAAAPASPMRAMKYRASFEASEALPTDKVTLSPGQAAPEPPAMPMMAMAAAPVPLVQPERATKPAQVTGQTWERIEVAPGVELHIEKRIAEAHRPDLAALLQTARRFFGQKEI